MARLHAAADYYVYFVGFTPGLPYMTGMPERLTIPRLDQPRIKTPPGSVSIGGIQCCIYSVESPGGFWVLGRTPLRLYDPAARRSDPAPRRRPRALPPDRPRRVRRDRGRGGRGRYTPRIAGPVAYDAHE